MFPLRDFWRRHKRKVIISLGAIGSGYALYKLYDAHRTRLLELEAELAANRDNDERIKAQLQEHFVNIQMIGDTMTIPHSISYLSTRVAEELDLSNITERLMQAKGQPNSLTSSEKLELWERLKILSFTRMVLSLWSMTLISLYVKVLVNILGRHLYIDAARDLQSSLLLEEAHLIESTDELKFLELADYLATNTLHPLIRDMEAAATESLKSKHLKDIFNTTTLQTTIMEILSTFMSSENKTRVWVGYLMPRSSTSSSSGDAKFDQMMEEARSVLSSDEFRNIVEASLKSVVESLVEEVNEQCGSHALSTGIPLARLLPRIAHTSALALDKPTSDEFVKIIRSIPEVGLFFTLLYSSGLHKQT
ncbi:hypothetical protein V2J09_019403 [Rumex salicifolius]